MYDFEWHKVHAAKTKRSAELILSTLRAVFAYESLLDVGCGDGLWLAASRALGCPVNKGVDGPWTKTDALLVPSDDVKLCDLRGTFALGTTFDLAISLEVAEHVDPKSAEIFVDNLVAHADCIVFGAAIPFQGGFRHVNEQWQSYWREKFAVRGYDCFDLVRPLVWDEPDVHYWYKQNALVYVKRTRTDLIAKITGYMDAHKIRGFPIDLVHAEKYEAIASYSQIAFKPLARQLPAQLGAKLRDMALMRT